MIFQVSAIQPELKFISINTLGELGFLSSFLLLPPSVTLSVCQYTVQTVYLQPLSCVQKICANGTFLAVRHGGFLCKKRPN